MTKPNLILGNCLEQMAAMPDNSVDSVVTDPPYGLSFMGKKWDYDVPNTEIWAECLRVLKPGGHLLAFAGTRTQHRMAVRIEDAGFEIRDMIAWVYGSGFPKSRNLDGDWEGWGTALKPALEPITVARKPLIGTVAANVLAHGTGALNVDGCRVAGEPWAAVAPNAGGRSGGVMGKSAQHPGGEPHDLGRWPANLIHDGSEEVISLMESPARFFYCAKASKRDRDEGCDAMPLRNSYMVENGSKTAAASNGVRYDRKTLQRNNHPTVKPTELMRYLCRLVTPPGGIVLDPFMGSGSTGKAAVLEGFDFIGIELNPEYFAIAEKRVATE